MSVHASVYEFARTHLSGLRRSGPEDVMANCPFHAGGRQQKTPSFALSLTTGLWICHSCKEKGNFRGLLRAFGVGGFLLDTVYRDVLVDLDSNLARRPRPENIKLSNPPLDESVLGLFDYFPMQMEDWGFNEDDVRRFNVGFDTKHMRITFPLRDLTGELVGVSGRAVTDDGPRYKIYGEKDWADWEIKADAPERSELVWNIDHVYPEAFFKSHSTDVVLVEGFKATMWVSKAGVDNVVAMVGSSMSDFQQMLLERLGGPFYLFFDNDESGQKATRYIGRRLAKSTKVYVCQYDAKQPTDLALEHVLTALDTAQDFTLWAMQHGKEYANGLWQRS